jgi:hypothetical protein
MTWRSRIERRTQSFPRARARPPPRDLDATTPAKRRPATPARTPRAGFLERAYELLSGDRGHALDPARPHLIQAERTECFARSEQRAIG